MDAQAHRLRHSGDERACQRALRAKRLLAMGSTRMESCKPQGLATGRGRGMESGRSGRPTLMASTLVATFFLYASDCRHIRTFNYALHG